MSSRGWIAAQLLITGCGLFSGCRLSSGEERALDVEVPESWLAEEDGGVVSDDPWWFVFEDADLTAAIEEALVSNRDLQGSLARVDAAAAQARIAGADLYPSLDASGSGQRAKQVFVGLPTPGGDVLESTTTSYGVSLDVSWEVDLWGRLRNRRAAAGEDLLASAGEYRAAQHSLAAQTAKGWYSLQEARLQIELAQRTVQTFERSVEIAQDRFDRGLTSSLDVRLARSDLESARALLEARRETEERTVRQLEILLGRYPAGELERPGRLPEIGEPDPAGVPSELLRRRPDLRAAEARLVATDYRIAAARADFYPNLVLSGSAGRTGEEVADLFDGDFTTWSLAGGVLQPIFQGGRLEGQLDLAQARFREAFADYASVVLRAFSEVETALAVQDLLARRAARLRVASQEASEASLLAEERYAAGLETLTTLLDAQRRALTNESAWLSSRLERIEARIDLYLSLGGGFGPEDGDLPVEPEP